MPKTYLRYEGLYCFGVISTTTPAVDASGDRIITGSLEYVSVWHARRGTLMFQLKDNETNAEVTEIALSPDGVSVAAGYADGTIKVWNLNQKKCAMSLTGHKSAVSCLRFNKSGALLASGSKDTNIIIWDIVSETGLYKLRGHKDMVTDCKFLEKSNKLVTSSKDSFMKIWDLETQHCVQTIVTHRNEVWSFDIDDDETRLVTGASDDKIRVWSLVPSEFPNLTSGDEVISSVDTPDLEAYKPDEEEMLAKYFGAIPRQSKERVVKVRYHPKNSILGVQATDNSIELFEIRSVEKISKRLKTRAKKEKKKEDKKAETEQNTEIKVDLKVSDELVLQQIVRASTKIKSFSFSPKTNQVIVSLTNNQLEIYNFDAKSHTKLSSIDLPGHRSDIRDLALSNDDNMLLSASNNAIKLWNVHTQSCLKTIPSGYGLSVVIAPGNNYVILGTKTGELEIFDLSSSTLVNTIKAHEGAVWSLDIKPDKTGLISGSADKSVKLWDFELVNDPANKNRKILSLTLAQTLTMTDDVLCVKYSPNGKLIAVALLDNTVKVFYAENLKFFLSLYGHKLPVMTLSISSDSQLIVTGSADKNVKIWGLDFGDCHKSLFAHEDSIMQVKFVPNTHYFWSCSKDKTVKYWDADKFEHVQTMNGHHAAVWAISVSSDGAFVVSSSQDRSIRFWRRTDEQLFLEEERERALESTFEVDDKREILEKNLTESVAAGKRTIETIKASERLAEAIQLAETETKALAAYKLELAEAEKLVESTKKKKANKGPLIDPPVPSPLLLGLSPSDYILKVIRDIRSNDLEEALLALPFHTAMDLFQYFDEFIKNGKSIELICRCLFYLIKVHHSQISANSKMFSLLESIQTNTRNQLQGIKDVIGFNRSAMKFVKRGIEQTTNSYFFEDQIVKKKQKKQNVWEYWK